MDMQTFQQFQRLPYESKVAHASQMARDFYNTITSPVGEYNGDCHVSVGGLDSITLLCFLRSIGIDVPAISVSVLEDKGNQEVHKQLGVISIAPYMSKSKVLNELGFPVVSKEKANKINYLLTPDSEKQTFVHAIMTGDMGAQGNFQHSNRIKLPDKWIKLFGYNYSDMRPDLISEMKQPPEFKVSSKCCCYMKEKPADDWAKEHNSYPFLGFMASEGGQREMGLMKNGCNYYGKHKELASWLEMIDKIKKKFCVNEIQANVMTSYNAMFNASYGDSGGSTVATYNLATVETDSNGNTAVTYNSVTTGFVPSITIEFMGNSYNLLSSLHSSSWGPYIEQAKKLISALLTIAFFIGLFRSLPSIIGGVPGISVPTSQPADVQYIDVTDSAEIDVYRPKHRLR